jgi:peroxiredoxin Q/BCP
MKFHTIQRGASLWGIATLTIAIAATAARAETTTGPKTDAPVKVGQPAPNFALTGEDGKKYVLSDQLGRWIVLAFYPADFTKGCTAEACALRDGMSDIKAMNARVFGISVQDAKSKKGFAEENKLNYHVLADDQRVVCDAYGTLTAPDGVSKRYTYYIDPFGIVRKIDEKVVPLVAARDVEDSLKELQTSDPPLLSAFWDENVRKKAAAAKADPNDRKAKDDLALAYYLKGRATMLQKRFPASIREPAALSLFKKALALNPNLAAAQEDEAALQKTKEGEKPADAK